MLKRREKCDTYLTLVCRDRWSGAESSIYIIFSPVMSIDVSQVGVTFFPSF